MGHSNGTYLLTKALREYPACKFENVVFAGSVVQAKFEWDEMVAKERIGKYYNFVATCDWVVAIFPKTFQRLLLQDLGSAGFDGFKQIAVHNQLKFIEGGHGAAINEKYWDEIANFIVDGKPSSSITKLSTENRPLFMKILGAAAPLPFFTVVALACGVGWVVFHFPDYISTGSFLKVPEIVTLKHIGSQGLGLALYLYCIWKVITRI